MIKRCLRSRLRRMTGRFVLFAPWLFLRKGGEHSCEGSLQLSPVPQPTGIGLSFLVCKIG